MMYKISQQATVADEERLPANFLTVLDKLSDTRVEYTFKTPLHLVKKLARQQILKYIAILI